VWVETSPNSAYISMSKKGLNASRAKQSKVFFKLVGLSEIWFFMGVHPNLKINKCTYLGINPADNFPLRTNFHTNGAGEQDVGCS
jgi:hypothetical protein